VGLDRIVMVSGSRDADRLELMGSISRMVDDVLPQLS